MKLDVWKLGGIPTARWITGLAIAAAIIVMILRYYNHQKVGKNEKLNTE